MTKLGEHIATQETLQAADILTAVFKQQEYLDALYREELAVSAYAKELAAQGTVRRPREAGSHLTFGSTSPVEITGSDGSVYRLILKEHAGGADLLLAKGEDSKISKRFMLFLDTGPKIFRSDPMNRETKLGLAKELLGAIEDGMDRLTIEQQKELGIPAPEESATSGLAAALLRLAEADES